MGLSMLMLGEKIIPKYDFTAALFICVGSGLTILQMNTTKDQPLTNDQAK